MKPAAYCSELCPASLSEVRAPDHSDQFAIGCRDDSGLEFALLELTSQRGEWHVRPDSRGSRLHDFLDASLGLLLEGSLAQPCEQRPLLGYDESEPVGRGLDARPDVADSLVDSRGCDVVAGDVAGARFSCLLAFGRQAAGKPVLLAGDVVEDRLEPERFEPARGSRADVS